MARDCCSAGALPGLSPSCEPSLLKIAVTLFCLQVLNLGVYQPSEQLIEPDTSARVLGLLLSKLTVVEHVSTRLNYMRL